MDRLQKVWRFKARNRQGIFLFIWNPWEPAADCRLARESQRLGFCFSFSLWAMLGRGFGGEERSDEVPPALGDVGWNPADVGRNRAGSDGWGDHRKIRKGLISGANTSASAGWGSPCFFVRVGERAWSSKLPDGDDPICPMEMTQPVRWRNPLLCRCGYKCTCHANVSTTL